MTTEQRLEQLEDRIAIRELIDAYAFCADTRNIQGHMALFTEDTNFEVYMDEKKPTPTQVVTAPSRWKGSGHPALPTAGHTI